jgi:alkylation response protein AidB-like acyl-CoA dehydrogenase
MVETAELEMLRDSARRLAESFRPERWSSKGRTGASNPRLWAAIAESGWLLCGLPEVLGGLGPGGVEVAAVMAEVGRGLIAEPITPNLLSLQIVARLAEPAYAAELIESVAGGRSKLAFAYAEQGSRFDWRSPRTSVRREGGALVLDGRKHVVLGAGDADALIVVARLAEGPAGELAVLLVPARTPGVRIECYPLVDGRGAGDVAFSDVRLTAAALLASGPEAVAAVDHALDVATVAVCAEAVGAMNAAFEMTLDYTKQRVQFGQPIGRNQALQHRLVDLLRLIKEAEILLQQAVEALDAGPVERGLAVSAAKIHTGVAARKVGQEAHQMHGAIASTDEAVISHHFRQLITLGVLYGDADHHRARFLALDRQAVA